LPTSLLPILGQLDQSHGDGEFLEVETGRRGLIRDRPDVFQYRHRKLGARKEFDRLGSADAALPLDVGGLEHCQVVWLFVLLGPVRY